MAEALIAAQLRSGAAGADAITACEKLDARRDYIGQTYGITVTHQPALLLENAETIVLAVKPQDLDALLDHLAPMITNRHLLISIAAGKSLQGMQSRVGPTARLARVMPNLAVQVGAGMSVYCLGDSALVDDRKRVESLLECAGNVLCLPESQFDWVTALSGSGPAFLAWLLSGLIAAAESAGMEKKVAHVLAVQTLAGTAQLLCEGGFTPDTLIRSVASPGGTTAAGLAVLDRSSVHHTLARTLQAAAARSHALSA